MWEIQAIIFLENVFTALVSYRIKFTWILFFENTLKIKNFFKKIMVNNNRLNVWNQNMSVS